MGRFKHSGLKLRFPIARQRAGCEILSYLWQILSHSQWKLFGHTNVASSQCYSCHNNRYTRGWATRKNDSTGLLSPSFCGQIFQTVKMNSSPLIAGFSSIQSAKISNQTWKSMTALEPAYEMRALYQGMPIISEVSLIPKVKVQPECMDWIMDASQKCSFFFFCRDRVRGHVVPLKSPI